MCHPAHQPRTRLARQAAGDGGDLQGVVWEGGESAVGSPRGIGCEAVRRLLVGGTIVLKPNAAHTSLEGAVRFVDLGDHVLGLAGVRRRVKHLAPTSQVTVVAGARYAMFAEAFCSPHSDRVK